MAPSVVVAAEGLHPWRSEAEALVQSCLRSYSDPLLSSASIYDGISYIVLERQFHCSPI